MSEESKERKAPRIIVEEISNTEKVSEPAAEVSTENKSEEITPKKVEEPKTVEKSKKPSSFKILWILIPGLLMLAILIGGIFVYHSGLSKLRTIEEPIPEPTAIPFSTPIPQPQKPDLTKYSITVLNGSGIKGEAGKVQTLLEKAGFKVASTSNAKTYDYKKTEISVQKDVDADFIKALIAALTKSYQLSDPKTATSQAIPVIITVGNLKAE